MAMRAHAMRIGRRGLALGVLALLMGADEPRLADHFGFLPLEVYKLDNRINGLLVRDLDGDKVEDIAVINNARSRIDLLLSTRKKPGGGEDEEERRGVEGGQPGPQRPPDAAGQRPGEQGRREPPGRRLRRRRQGRPGLLRRAGRDRDPLQPRQRPVRRRQADQRRRGRRERGGPERRRPRQGRPRRPRPDRQGRDRPHLSEGEGEAGRARAAPAHPGQRPDGQGRRHRRRRPRRPGHAQRRPRRPDPDPVRRRAGRTLRPRGAVPRREPPRLRLRPDRREARLRAADDRAAVGPDPRPDPRLRRRRRRLEARAGSAFYPLPPGSTQGRSIDVGDLDGDGKVEVVATDPARAQVHVYRRSGKGRARHEQDLTPASPAAARSAWPTSTATARPRSTSSPRRRSRSAGASWPTAG